MISRFNQIGLWVAKTIIEPTSLKGRSKRMEKMINIAKHLRSMNNFSNLMAFVGGINNAAIQRLRWTRASMSKPAQETLEKFEKLMKSDVNYKAYRDCLQNSNPPAIPYIGVFLQDLTFIEDGNPDIIRDNLINFSKRRLLYSVISKMLLYQEGKEYDFHPIPAIQAVINEIPNDINEKELYNVSLLREPRGSEKNEIAP